MSPRTLSVATLIRISAVTVGLTILAGCGGGSGSTPTPPGTPAVTLSATSLTFPEQVVGTTSAALSVTVTNSGSATLNLTGLSVKGDFAQNNNCGEGISTFNPASLNAGGACTINVTFTPTQTGTRTGTLTIIDNASGSPHTVGLTGVGTSVSLTPTTLTFTGVEVHSSSAPQPVTLNNTGSAALAISSIAVTVGSSDFSQTNTCGSRVAAGGSCTINVTITPAASGTLTGTLTVTDNARGVAGSTQTVALTGTSNGSNTVAVNVSFGPSGYQGSANSYYDGIFTTVTVCQPGTTTCQTIPNVLVDTGSVGLRVLSDQMGSLSLPPISNGSGDSLYSCVEYADGTYTWGPMQMASIQIGGETATQIPASAGGTTNSGVPIQIITVGGTAPAGASCASGGGGSDNSVSALGANGILGVGNFPQDCGTYCESAPSSYTSPPWPYIACNSTSCGYAEPVPVSVQAWNPVSAFTSPDTNGVLVQLPSIPAAGAATVQGSLIFGIGTQANNAIPSAATTYELDGSGNFASAVFNGVTYTTANSGGSFIDSGSNAFYVSDSATLGSASGVTTPLCTDNGYYCPNSTLNLGLNLGGSSGTSGSVTLNISNADSLFAANPNNPALNNLGGSSGGTGPSTDYFDLGLPFFFGRSIFVGIEGTSSTYPHGYWAF